MARQEKISLFAKVDPRYTASGKAETLKSLAGLSGQAQSLAVEGLNKQAAIVGREEALKADITAGKPPEMQSEFTVRGQAYNQVATQAYKAEVQLSARENISRLMREHESDSEAFKIKSEAYRNGILSNIDNPLARKIAEQEIDGILTNARIKVEGNEFKETQRQAMQINMRARKAFEDQIAQAARDGDVDLIQELELKLTEQDAIAVKHNYATETEIEAAKDSLRARIVEEANIGKIKRLFDQDIPLAEKISQAEDLIDTIEKGNLKGLRLAEKDRILKKARIIANEQANIERASIQNERNAQAKEISDLILRSDDFNSDKDAILKEAEERLEGGTLTPSEYRGIVNNIESTQARFAQQVDTFKNITDVISGKQTRIPIEQKDLDKYYESILPAMEQLDPMERNADITSIAKNTGMIPKLVKQQVINFSNSDDPEKIMEAADLVSRIDDIPNVLDNNFSARERAFVMRVESLSRSMDPEKAVELARSIREKPNFAEMRKEVIKDKIGSDSPMKFYSEKAKSTIGMFESINDLSLSNMAKDYQSIYESHILNGLEPDDAEEIAEKLLRKQWAEDSITGKVMKYPMGRYYDKLGDDGALIKAQIFDALEETIGKDRALELDIDSDIAFVSDDVTAREASTNQPTYRMLYRDNSGAMVPVMKNGIFQRFKPFIDVSLQTKAKEEKERLLQEAETKQQQRKEGIIKKEKARAKRLKALEGNYSETSGANIRG